MLVVTDFGQRVQTPWRDALPRRQIKAISASSASARISQQNSQNKKEPLYQDPLPAPIDDYQRIGAKQPKPRHPVYLAEQIMSSDVIAIELHRSAQDAWQVMQSSGLHHLPIVDATQQLRGIISDRDLFNEKIRQQRLEQIMQTRVVCASSTTAVRDIAEAMINYRIGALPLIDDNNRIEGIITRHDILKAVVQQAPIELWT